MRVWCVLVVPEYLHIDSSSRSLRLPLAEITNKTILIIVAAPSPLVLSVRHGSLPLRLNYPMKMRMLRHPSAARAGRPMGIARGVETAAARSAPPSPSRRHRWRCVCCGVCVCGNVVLAHFPTIVAATGRAHTWLVYITGAPPLARAFYVRRSHGADSIQCVVLCESDSTCYCVQCCSARY